MVSKPLESIAHCRGLVSQMNTFIARACDHCVGIADEIERVNGFHVWAGNLELAVWVLKSIVFCEVDMSTPTRLRGVTT